MSEISLEMTLNKQQHYTQENKQIEYEGKLFIG